MTVNTYKVFFDAARLDRNNDGSVGALKPLTSIDYTNDGDLLEWHQDNMEALSPSHTARTSMYYRNRDLFKGLHNNASGNVGVLGDPLSDWGTSKFKMPEIVVNHSYELTEQKTSKLARYIGPVDVLPKNSEEGDRNAARSSQMYANHIGEEQDVKSLLIDLARDSKIGGESFLFIDWDENAGDLDPDFKKAKKKGFKLPLKDEAGNDMKSADGKPLYIEENHYVGDIVTRHRSVPEVMMQPKDNWRDVEWITEIDLVDIDTLKRDHPDKLAVLNETPLMRDSSNATTMVSPDYLNLVIVYTYWHKRIRGLDKGRKIVCVDNGILYNEDHPFSGAPLNVVRLTDIDVKGELHGWSFLNQIAPMQIAINKLYTLWYKNIAMGSHLYWLIPANARIARDKIRNSNSVLLYHGTTKPEIATFKTVSADLMQLIEKFEQRILTVAMVQSTSRGELPPNVEAGVAIGLLEEQENQAAAPDIKKFNAAIEKLYKLYLGVAGDKFKAGDGRTARILGKEGEFLMKSLDTAKLSGPYDFKVKKATAFSQSKPLMIQQITQMEAMRPGFLTNEQLYDLLDLGDAGKFYDITTAALRAAEYENERMRDGEEVKEPTPEEFLEVHWTSHMMEMQTPSFKEQASQKTRTLFIDHMITTEFMLFEKAKRSMALAQKLATKEYFPAFYVPEISLVKIIAGFSTGQEYPLAGEVPQAVNPMADQIAQASQATSEDVAEEVAADPLLAEEQAFPEGQAPAMEEEMPLPV